MALGRHRARQMDRLMVWAELAGLGGCPIMRGRPTVPGRRRGGGSNSRGSRRRQVIMQTCRRTAFDSSRR